MMANEKTVQDLGQNTGLADRNSPFYHYNSTFDVLSIVVSSAEPDLKPTEGYLTNFLGVLIDPKFFPGLLDGRAGQVEDLPIPGNWHADVAEFATMLRAVGFARQRFTMIELGCGWGCWLNNAGTVARRHGLDVRLIGVEADERHIEFARESVATNGFLPSQITLHRGIAASTAGVALFPRQGSDSASWGLEPIFGATEPQRRDGVAAGTYEELPMIALGDIVAPHERIDFLHVDIQGGELELVQRSLPLLDEKVAYVFIGTHSRQIEGALFALMLDAGWLLEIERPGLLKLDDARPYMWIDGVQGWRNPRLLPAENATVPPYAGPAGDPAPPDTPIPPQSPPTSSPPSSPPAGGGLKARLRSVIEQLFRRLPVSRLAYLKWDELQSRLAMIEAAPPLPQPAHDPRRLEMLEPVQRSPEERTVIATRCRDADMLAKVANAGSVVREPDGTAVQIMHNGIKVLAGGYYGEWMQDLISRCRGHHEPQEELLFTEVLRHIPGEASMIELGGFWSFYSIWFLTQDSRRRSLVVEADPKHLEIGRTNARLNGCAPVFIPAFVGARPAPPAPFQTESSGLVDLPCVSVASLLDEHGIQRLDLLHCDAQGAEFAIVESCLGLAAAGRLDWVIISTHSHHITNDPLTHQRCLAALRRAGATILAEHDVQESFSGDGLIVARFGAAPADWASPRLSFNRYSESLFRNPLYDLAQISLAAKPPQPAAASGEMAMLERSATLAVGGVLVNITADCALGVAGSKLLLPMDKVMFPEVVANSGWGLETHQFLDRRLDPAKPYMLLDIGANIGLFSRQAALRYPCITRMLCVEADPGNFQALQYNMAEFGGERCTLHNLALSSADGEMRFFRDRENFGNYSLNSDAMRGRPFDTVVIRAAEVGAWMERHVTPLASTTTEFRLIWKSDTQGHDELIISRTPMAIWNRLDAAIIELWRIKKPAFDRAAFVERLNSFAHMSIGLAEPCSTDDVLRYLDSEDWNHADLYLWR